MGHKSLIDVVYDKNYKSLLDFSRVQIDQSRRIYDEYMVVAECYEFIINYDKWDRDIILECDIMKMSYTWIKSNVKWQGSVLQSRKFRDIGGVDLLDSEGNLENDFYYGIENKDINLTLIHNILKDFESGLNIYDRGLWEMWHHKALQDSQSISDNLGLKKSSGYLVFKECRELNMRFRTYLLNRWFNC